MRIILHGTLAERFGREHEILTNVAAEAIEGLSRQLPGWPRDLAIDAVGFPTEDLLRAPTDVEELHLMPSMYGGSGGFAKIVIGAALIAVAIFVPGLGTFLGASVASMLFMAGASLALMGVAELLMSAPKIDSGGNNDPAASKYLGINRNTVAIGTLIIMAYGRMKLGGHWLSLQSNSSQLVTTTFPVTTS